MAVVPSEPALSNGPSTTRMAALVTASASDTASVSIIPAPSPRLTVSRPCENVTISPAAATTTVPALSGMPSTAGSTGRVVASRTRSKVIAPLDALPASWATTRKVAGRSAGTAWRKRVSESKACVATPISTMASGGCPRRSEPAGCGKSVMPTSRRANPKRRRYRNPRTSSSRMGFASLVESNSLASESGRNCLCSSAAKVLRSAHYGRDAARLKCLTPSIVKTRVRGKPGHASG